MAKRAADFAEQVVVGEQNTHTPSAGTIGTDGLLRVAVDVVAVARTHSNPFFQQNQSLRLRLNNCPRSDHLRVCRRMHHALEIEEILANIFCSFAPRVSLTEQAAAPDLAALARTCRTFREPALDLLWRALVDSSPLARCLPHACYYHSARKEVRSFQVHVILCLVKISIFYGIVFV